MLISLEKGRWHGLWTRVRTGLRGDTARCLALSGTTTAGDSVVTRPKRSPQTGVPARGILPQSQARPESPTEESHGLQPWEDVNEATWKCDSSQNPRLRRGVVRKTESFVITKIFDFRTTTGVVGQCGAADPHGHRAFGCEFQPTRHGKVEGNYIRLRRHGPVWDVRSRRRSRGTCPRGTSPK